MRFAWAALVLLAAVPGAGRAQTPEVRVYSLNVASWQGASPFGPAGAFDVQRLRFMADPRLGPARLDLAYEHTLLWRQDAGAGPALTPGGAAPASTDWLDLEWSLDTGEHVDWRHRFDRLSADWSPRPDLELTVGRQPVSWATTLYFTPADPFAPFDPSDPFREYRAGVDGARLQWFAGPFTTVDLVVRPEDTYAGYRTTALIRASGPLGAWDLSAWAGALHDDPAAAAGATRTLGGWAVRGDVAVRRGTGGDAVLRAAAGADRRVGLLGRDLYLLAEVQHDGFGATDAPGLVPVLGSPAYRRGELQTLGRDEALGDLSWQVHPLVAAEFLAIVNLRDGSALWAPAAAVSISDEVSARGGLYLASGDGATGPAGLPASEYGALPTYVYLSLTAFF